MKLVEENDAGVFVGANVKAENFINFIRVLLIIFYYYRSFSSFILARALGPTGLC